MVIGMPESFAAWAKSFAGRACRPWAEPIRTVREMGGIGVTSLSSSVSRVMSQGSPGAARGRSVPPGASDRVADQRKRPRAIHVREDVGRQQHHRRAAGRGIPLDALQRMSEMRPDEHDVGGIEVDGERLLGACEGGIGETLVRVLRVAPAARRTCSKPPHHTPPGSSSTRLHVRHSCEIAGSGQPLLFPLGRKVAVRAAAVSGRTRSRAARTGAGVRSARSRP